MARLAALVRGRRVLALTGAGCSTASGIPDYRGEGTRQRAKTPVQYRDFTTSEAIRRRYWARARIGWQRIATARPNPAHDALASLERAGVVSGLITQNVDRLHHAAGSRNVVELHGALERVRCLGCGTVSPRADLQARLEALNPAPAPAPVAMAPDGDAELHPEDVEGFVVPACERCGGVLKPDVVFFGENVPAPTVERAYAMLGEAEVLLVAGSSLAVFSGYRFVRRAAKEGKPVAIVNLGPTRGDPQASLRVDDDVVRVLPELARDLPR